MRLVCFLFFCVLTFTSGAQQLQQEINDQVWKPFIAALNNNNTEGFMAVHSKDLVRSPRDAKQVIGWEEYRKGTQSSNEWSLKNKIKSRIELRFTERIAQGNLAMEVGVYKTMRIDPDGKEKSFYGRFHVTLRKENGSWKVLVDTDSSEGNTIGEKDFLGAKPME